ncbi:MAG: LptF/LptG family permease, partial [Candidatus Omnitrophica bacterium]|nr:LptF/LptG family permease [Candidatus Omnitrophota bacterium]
SILHLSFPILFFSLFISFVSLFAQERILTSSQKRIEDIRIQFIKKDFAKAHEEKRLYFATPNKVLFAETFSPKTATLTNVKIFHKNDSEYITKQTFALSISYTQGAWEGKDVMEYAIDEEGAFIGAPFRWDKKVIELDQSPQELLVRKNLLASTSSLKNLRQEIKRLRKIHASKELDKLIIKYNQRLSTPFSHIFLIVGILPLALEIKKRKTSFSALALGFIFGLFYYCFDQFSIVLGGSDFIIPILSAWVAPLFFVTVGLTGLVLIR